MPAINWIGNCTTREVLVLPHIFKYSLIELGKLCIVCQVVTLPVGFIFVIIIKITVEIA